MPPLFRDGIALAAFSDLGPDATVGTLFDLIFDQLTQTPAAGPAHTDR